MLSTSSVILPSPWMARSITGPSALDAPGAAAPSQLFHLGDRDYVAVAEMECFKAEAAKAYFTAAWVLFPVSRK